MFNRDIYQPLFDQVLAGHLLLLHVGDCQPDTLQHPRAAQQLLRRRVKKGGQTVDGFFRP